MPDSDVPSAEETRSLPARPTNTRWLIFFLACFTSFLTYIHRYSWGATRPFFKEDYGLTDQEMGWLDASFNLTYAFGQFPGGWAGDVFGPRLMIPIAALLWSIMMIGPALTGWFWGLMGTRLTFGATQAPCYPNLGKITKNWFPLRIRTTLQGIVASFSGRAGGAIAPFLIGTVFMAGIGLSWQMSLYTLAGVGAFFAVGFWFVFRDSPSEHPWCNSSEQELIEADETPVTAATAKIQWTTANRVNLGLFMTASFLSTFADNLFVFYMPQYLIEEKGFTEAQMGLFAGLPIWGGAIGGMCGGVLNDLLIRKLATGVSHVV